eukprot:31475-Pelagococcus_subviridis.AAC.7
MRSSTRSSVNGRRLPRPSSLRARLWRLSHRPQSVTPRWLVASPGSASICLPLCTLGSSLSKRNASSVALAPRSRDFTRAIHSDVILWPMWPLSFVMSSVLSTGTDA